MVPIHDRPLLDYWLELLFSAGIERALINTHYLPEPVRAHVAQTRWRDRIDLAHEAELLGTGGTIWANRSYFGDESFFVAHADNLTDFDVGAFMAAHASRPPECHVTMMAFRTDDPGSCGILEVDGRGIVQAFHEKVENPPGNLANGAVYILTPEVVRRLGAIDRPSIDLSVDVMPALVGHILAVESASYHRDIGNLESLRQAHFEFRSVRH